MSDYSIEMSETARNLLSGFEEMPEYGKVMGFLDKWDLGDRDTWMKVNTNIKFKRMRNRIMFSCSKLDYYRDATLERMKADCRPLRIVQSEEDFIASNKSRYEKMLKKAAELIERFEMNEEYYLERDKTSEWDADRTELDSYEMSLRGYEEGTEFEL